MCNHKSFVTKTLRFFPKLIVTRFVRFCQTWLRPCKVWPICLISTVEEKTLIFCSALCQPRSLAWMSQHREPRRHTLLPFFSSATINSQPLSLSLSLYCIPISFPLSFFHPPRFSFSLCLLWFSPSFTLSSITWGLYFLETQGEKPGDQGVPRRHGKFAENPHADLNSQLTSYTFFRSLCLHEKNLKELWERQGSGRLVNIRGHLETLQHLHSMKVCQSVWYDWKSVKEKAWWDISAAVSHTLHT